MDYREEAEKLVRECRRLEKEYVRAFMKDPKDLRTCEMVARRLEKIDPDLRLQVGSTLHPMHRGALEQSRGRQKDISQFENFVRIAMRLLKEGKYKPLT